MVKLDWAGCNKKGMVKKISPDNNLILSLLDSSSKKLKVQDILPLNKLTSSSKISLAYDGLRILLEALSIKKGFKIYNHECYTAFLIEILNESTLAESFDKIRKLRNAINYYGKDFLPEESSDIVSEIKSLIQSIQNNYFTK